MKKLAALTIIILLGQICFAQPFDGFGGQPSRTSEIDFQAIASHDPAAPAGKVTVALDISIADNWVYYSPDPGDYVIPAAISITGENIKPFKVLWPADKEKTYTFGDTSQTNNVYAKHAVVFVELPIPGHQPIGEEFNFTVALEGQVCDAGESGLCKNISGVQQQVSIAISETASDNPQFSKYAELATKNVPAAKLAEIRVKPESQVAQPEFSGASLTWGFWTAFGLAMLAGLSLNITPCVLPVIPIRILSVVSSAGQSRRRFVVLGLSFALGIFVFFAVVAGVNLILRLTTDQAFNISQHFQYREVRIALAMIVVALAANLFGVFAVIVPSKVASIGAGKKSATVGGTVSMGIMMAVLSTPCSAAFVAGAFAWAQVHPPLVGTIIIAVMGIGMAAPHALLCAFPQLVDKLPKPGKWMEMLRHAMGFLLLPVAAWLVGTLANDTYPVWVTCFAVVLVFSLWMWSAWVRYDSPFARKFLIRAAAVVLVVASGIWMLPKKSDNGKYYEFNNYNATAIQAAREQSRTVAIKFTASWCTKCKILDYTVFKTPEITELFRRNNVYAVEADVTDRDMPASALLNEKYGGAPPVTVIFKGTNEPKVFVGGFDKQTLMDAVEN